MTTTGYIKLHRKVVDSWLWTLPLAQRAVLLELLLLARWDATPYRHVVSGGEIITIERGQYLTSTRALAKRLGVDKNTVTRALKVGHLEGYLTRHPVGQHGEILTICNYERYQGSDDQPGTPVGTPVGTPAHHPCGQERRRKRKNPPSEKTTSSPQSDGGRARPAAPPPEYRQFTDHVTTTWKQAHGGVRPPWRKAEWTQLAEAWKAMGADLMLATLAWDRFVGDTSPFTGGHDPKLFAKFLSRYVTDQPKTVTVPRGERPGQQPAKAWNQAGSNLRSPYRWRDSRKLYLAEALTDNPGSYEIFAAIDALEEWWQRVPESREPADAPRGWTPPPKLVELARLKLNARKGRGAA